MKHNSGRRPSRSIGDTTHNSELRSSRSNSVTTHGNRVFFIALIIFNVLMIALYESGVLGW